MPRAKTFVPDEADTLPPAVHSSVACGHINRQFYDTDGKLTPLACTLPKGHAPVLLRTEKIKDAAGNITETPVYGAVHLAEYEYMKTDIIPPLKQRVSGAKITYIKTKARGEWTDAAGVPAPQQKPE